jgi:hypothetical protein
MGTETNLIVTVADAYHAWLAMDAEEIYESDYKQMLETTPPAWVAELWDHDRQWAIAQRDADSRSAARKKATDV